MEGIPCEVRDQVAQRADIALRGWLKFEDFRVLGPPNGGWVLFCPTGELWRPR